MKTSKTVVVDEGTFLKGDGEFSLEIVGESHYQDAIAKACGGRTAESQEKTVKAELVLDNKNRFDPNAVRIDIDGMTVGYLRRETAVIFRRLVTTENLKAPFTCNAMIVGGWDRGGGDKGSFGVRLDVI